MFCIIKYLIFHLTELNLAWKKFQVTKSVVSLLDYYKWYKFSIIYEEAWYTVAQSLVQEAKKKNMTINDEKKAKDSYKCCAEQLTCCGSGYWYQFIQNTKNRTRSKTQTNSRQNLAFSSSLCLFGRLNVFTWPHDHNANSSVIWKWWIHRHLCWY